MTNWNEGYITSSNYTSGYYHELSPSHIRFNLLMKGIALPNINELNYLELGYGQGLSLNIHAAATSGTYYGTDFNPSHTLEAKALSKKAGSSLTVYDESFEIMANRDDLPQFDIIALHGIWSWVSDDNRKNLVRILEKNLKVGGVVYIGYNTYPGWSMFAPVRELMKLHSNSINQPTQHIYKTIPEAIAFIESLSENTLYIKNTPSIKTHIDKLKDMSVDYLAHEYFNADWKAYYFYEMCRDLETAKLSYTASATTLHNIKHINFTSDIVKELNSYDDIMIESLHDFSVNQTFRRDLFTKGTRKLNKAEHQQVIDNLELVLLKPQQKIDYKVNTILGELTLKESLYKPLIEQLAQNNYCPKKIKDLYATTELSREDIAQTIEILSILEGSNTIALAQDKNEIAKNKTKTTHLNKYLCESALSAQQHIFLASPVTATGLPASRFEMLAIKELLAGVNKKEEIAKNIYASFEAKSEYLIKNNEQMNKNEALKTLENVVQEFFDEKLEIFKALQII